MVLFVIIQWQPPVLPLKHKHTQSNVHRLYYMQVYDSRFGCERSRVRFSECPSFILLFGFKSSVTARLSFFTQFGVGPVLFPKVNRTLDTAINARPLASEHQDKLRSKTSS